MKRILIIEDNRNIAGILFDYFESNDISLDYADNGELGVKLAQEVNFDIILLDLMLPRMNGLQVCETLRELGNKTPILMLTALDSKEDMLTGFKYGADDYVTKPFDLSILEARMHALINRYRETVAKSILSFSTITIDQKSHTATREGKSLILNPTTYTILELLCIKAPAVLTRQELIQTLWKEDKDCDAVLRTHIYQLRRQLDKPFAKAMLLTVPKVGFKLEADSNDAAPL
ncbi:response regulator transcription factor [Vibrio sp. 99-8-1]|uniref:response regulator transcription factor n=1 Tax=Vibrio sp. 99-8-1 TaxID=2607602 RepID=UPI00149345D1|nr:response regulator transcription factor [Vibrio sp. 99-8-1]NOI67242.1 response regulator transcription factor [Vibrio sp. 99-8-1]